MGGSGRAEVSTAGGPGEGGACLASTTRGVSGPHGRLPTGSATHDGQQVPADVAAVIGSRCAGIPWPEVAW